MNMTTLYHWEGGGEVDSTGINNVYNEVWGYAQNNREYAIIGTTEGTHFLDITEITEAYEADFIPGRQQGSTVVHRDYHNYNNYLFMVCQQGESSLQIADLSYLPDSVHLVYDSEEILRVAHNIFIDTTQAVLYTVIANRDGIDADIRMQRIDISNPATPQLIEEFPTGVYIHDLYVNDGLALLNRGNTDMAIFDYNTTPAQFLGSIDNYPGQGYNHSGYPNPEGTIYAMADETFGSPIKILDISDPSDIEVLATVSSGVNDLSVPHNQIIHENKVYSSYYFDGVYVWSIIDPENPILLGFYDTSSVPNQGSSLEGAWGVYPFLPSGRLLVSDIQTGLWVFELDETLGASSVDKVEPLRLWPNPAESFIQIDNSSFQNGAQYTVFEISGKIVLSGTLATQSNMRIRTDGIENGLYLISLQDKNGIRSAKFVVQN